MSMLPHAPRLGLTDAVRLARELYGLDATARELPSERDQNFALVCDGGPFVLKIANATESRAQLDAENGAMTWVAGRGGSCPRVIRGSGGESIHTHDGHFVRLLTWIQGVTLASVRDHPPALLEDLGRHVGHIDRALADFDHPAAHRQFHWDLAAALRTIRRSLLMIEDPKWRAFIERETDTIERCLKPDGLRRSVIHNDANDHNVIVREPDGEGPNYARVSGIIDFGDLVYSYTVADLAVAIAYAVLDKPNPLGVSAHIVRGYHGSYPLVDPELEELWSLVRLRLCLSAALAAEQHRQRPDDEYLVVSQASIRRTLPRLAEIPARERAAAFRTAGGISSIESTISTRREYVGRNLRVGYRSPIKAARGWMQYLYDAQGRRFLDGYNNVPHVGHCHPRVVAAAADQASVLNTNTRYLHDSLGRFAERLSATVPAPLRVCYFVNSGSEANELALRLARAHTRRDDVIVLESAYHGNTTTLIDISPYKFNGPGGAGQRSWVHVAPMPDVYRGAFKKDHPEPGRQYAEGVGTIARDLVAAGSGPAAFIAESCPSVGGQIVFPSGYLQAVYASVREAGGVCIADEVQTGYGRMGSTFYAFEDQQVVPDIVVLGKPIGNGYPLGAVITTDEIAASFDNGMEFFSTFGGSTVSCAVGLAVLDVVRDEQLQRHAADVGRELFQRLEGLRSRHELIGDVRGSGLFAGVELVRSRDTLEPATREAGDVVNRLREEGVLIGTDGPYENVLKIRPPMPFDAGNAELLVSSLDRVLGELT
jgi:4-aminobutyrate aminotransferase-like enzyme/Ser/Thr protein kinase RdoA (MazF antagonist)